MENQDEPNVKCPNHLLCGDDLYCQCYLDCCNGVCINCDMTFGNWKGGTSKLTFSDSDCPVCLEEDITCIDFPSCKRHKICVECFKNIIDPEFPKEEPELTDEQYELIIDLEESNKENLADIKYPEWYNDHKRELEIWEDEYMIFCEENDYKKRCPICRDGL